MNLLPLPRLATIRRNDSVSWPVLLALIVPLACASGAKVAAAESSGAQPAAKTKSVPPDPATTTGWLRLFDGKTLKGWKPTDFAGKGEVKVEDGKVLLEMGNDMTGITWTNKAPEINYELYLEAMRVEGSDFFCGLTFPVKKDPCSLIVGGWGGGLVGLSSVDGFDAANNETSTYMGFKDKQWYKIRLRVTPAKIEAWIDDKQVVDLALANRTLSVRIEVEQCRPLGVATWRTAGALRHIQWRPLED